MKQEERALLAPGASLVARYMGREYRCQVVRSRGGGSRYEVDGIGAYTSPSGAATAVITHANPGASPSRNGYEFWDFEDVAAAEANVAQPNSPAAVVLTAADEIQAAQEAFTRAFRKGAAPIAGVRFGFQGGFVEETAYWLEAESIWLASRVAPEGNRFWNALGTSEPSPGGLTSITCEVNSPLEGVNRRIGGCFAREIESGHTLVLHRGKIGGGRAGIGPDAFWDSYEGAEIVADDGGENRRLALVTDLNSDEVQGDVSEFVRTVERVKREAIKDTVAADQVERYWWVNQGGSHQEEVDGSYLWAPVRAGKRELAHHRNMADLQVGDRVFHYWGGRIQAVSSVAEAAVLSQIPTELPDDKRENEGRLARVEVKEVGAPVPLGDIPPEWRVKERGPFNRKGGVKQGYLYPLSAEFVAKLEGSFPQLAERISIDSEVESEASSPYVEPDFETIRSRIEEEGLVVSDRTLRRFHLSLRSRGFVILSGISGTGKTWLAQAYAKAVGGRECLVAVAPNWTTNEDLIGYFNPFRNEYYHTPFSRFLQKAAIEWESATAVEREPVPYYLVLDEMNLARVEYYFATFLSALEVRQREKRAPIRLAEEEVELTPNLRFVGTVNVDETTHGFADKVYDRAQLVELEAPREAIQRHLADWALSETLLSAWDALHEVAPFAFRVIDDIRSYVGEAEALGVDGEAALDEQMLQKLLPKVHGIGPLIEQALAGFIEVCGERFPLSAEKARRMRVRFNEHGSVSYFA